jgi:hypothetical protein
MYRPNFIAVPLFLKPYNLDIDFRKDKSFPFDMLKEGFKNKSRAELFAHLQIIKRLYENDLIDEHMNVKTNANVF